MVTRYWELLIGAIFLVLLLTVFFIAGAKGWGGPPNDSCWVQRPQPAHPCYCESIGEPGEGMIRQPSNTWSALGFSVLGLIILGIRSYERSQGVSPRRANPMTTTSFFPVALGLIVIYMGPGSMFFHASIRQWGGWLDSMSMVFWSDFLLFYSLIRLFRINYRDPTWAILLIVGYVAVAMLMGILIAALDEQATLLFGLVTVIAVVVLLINQIKLAVKGEADAASWVWLGVATAVFAAALAVWKLAPCSPTSPVQFHALWHLASAAGVFLLYWYFRSGSESL